MKIYAVVRNGMVENLIVVDEAKLFTIPGAELVPAGDNAEIGGHYDGEKFIPRGKE